jgi:hypothetical protein
VWAMCMHGVVAGLSLNVFSFTSVYNFVSNDTNVGSYFVYVDFVWGPIYLVYNCCYKHFFGWWLCEDGHLMWLFIRNMLLRLSMNMCVSNRVVYVVFMAISMTLISACKMFWYLST